MALSRLWPRSSLFQVWNLHCREHICRESGCACGVSCSVYALLLLCAMSSVWIIIARVGYKGRVQSSTSLPEQGSWRPSFFSLGCAAERVPRIPKPLENPQALASQTRALRNTSRLCAKRPQSERASDMTLQRVSGLSTSGGRLCALIGVPWRGGQF